LKKSNADVKCKKCRGVIPLLPSTMIANLIMDGDEIEAIQSFCYLSDTIGQSGGCLDVVTARIKSVWGAFAALLHILTNKAFSIRNRGTVFNSCVKTVLTYGSETWAITVLDTQRPTVADRGMIRWIFGIKLDQRIPTIELLRRLNINRLEEVIRWNRLQLKGHLVRMDYDVWPKKVLEVEAPGRMP